MAGDCDKDEPVIDTLTLGYATHIGQYRQSQSHPQLMVLLIGVTTLAGAWSIILGVTSLGDAWGFGLLLIGAGVSLCSATLGKLSAAKLQLKPAILLLILSIAIEIPIVIIAHRLYEVQHASYARDLAARQSDFEHLPTEAEHQVFTYAMVRDSALISISLAIACMVYATIRLAARRGVDCS